MRWSFNVHSISIKNKERKRIKNESTLINIHLKNLISNAETSKFCWSSTGHSWNMLKWPIECSMNGFHLTTFEYLSPNIKSKSIAWFSYDDTSRCIRYHCRFICTRRNDTRWGNFSCWWWNIHDCLSVMSIPYCLLKNKKKINWLQCSHWLMISTNEKCE